MPFGAERATASDAIWPNLVDALPERGAAGFELVPMPEVAVTFSATVSVTPFGVPVRLVPRVA